MSTSKTYQGFYYLKPKTVKEACALLLQHKGEARVIAGGTDLKVMMKNWGIMPGYLVSLETIADLKYITQDGDVVKIGALSTMAEVANSPVIQKKFPMLVEAAGEMGSPQIRNAATVAGNICRAAPSADTATPLIALTARAKITSASGERTIDLEKFFAGPGETILKNGEILTEIQIPVPAPNSSGTYLRMTVREALAIAIVGVAALVTLDAKKNTITDARIVLGAIAPTPIRATKAEDLLKGQTADINLIEKVAQAASEAAKPISDIRGTAEYRQEMVKVLTNQALQKVALPK
jgi:carbon-monoxide dehydrogenase medium subunit